VSNRRRRGLQGTPSQSQSQQQAPCSPAAAVSLDNLDLDAFCDKAMLVTPDDITIDNITPEATCVQNTQRMARSTAPASSFDMMNCIFSANLDNAASSSVCSASTSALPLLLDFTEAAITTENSSSSNKYFNFSQEFDMTKAVVPVLYPKPFSPIPYPTQPVDLIIPYSAIDPRLHFAMEQFCSAPRQTVVDCHTPWSHKRLYTEHTVDGELPKSIAAAQACCALHIARNSTNSAIITRNIVQKARQICRESPLSNTGDGSGSRSRKTPAKGEDATTLELLARTQALLLFHIMLQTDTNPLPRDTLPHTCQALDITIMALHRRTIALSSPYIADNEPLPISWKTDQDRARDTETSWCFGRNRDGEQANVHEVDMDNSPWLPVGMRGEHATSEQSRTDYSATGNTTKSTTTSSSSSTEPTPSPPNHTSLPRHSPPTTPKPMPPLLVLSPLHQTRATYLSWILHESCRRTVLAAAIFQLLQQLLGNSHAATTLQCPRGSEDMREFCASAFTVSRECWDEARDCVDFAVAWNRKDGTVLRTVE